MIEIIISVAFIAVLLTASYSVYRLSLSTAELARERAIAELLAQDILELTVSKRNENWNSLQVGEWHFTEDPVLGIVFAAGPETTADGFTRKVIIEQANRLASGDLTLSGGTPDPDSFVITAQIDWAYQDQAQQLTFVRFVSNWKKF